ncbi:MAG: GMC oxidoreductase, partial [Pseudomonadota bacterium]|nr:GMC oxidoreductase [Pseudomonadota bacterium]
YGTERLRVVDSSIMPNMPTSNTNAPSIVIGERGADMILADANCREESSLLPALTRLNTRVTDDF